MDSRLAAWLSLSLFACTPTQPPAPPATVEPASPAVVAAPPAATPEPAAPASECRYPAEPPTLLPALVPTDPATTCRKPAASAKASLHAQIRKQWSRTWPKSRLEIRDGCDRLDEQLDTITFASSAGHGGSLTLGSLDRQPDGDYALVLLDYNHYARARRPDEKDPYREDSSGTLHIYRTTIKAKKIAPLLASLRAAAHVEIEEHEPPPIPGSFSAAGFGSSHDYHLALRLADHAGHGVERRFAGYASGGPEQKDGVPMAIAQTALDKLVEDVTKLPDAGGVDTSDRTARAVFARLFWQSHARGPDYDYWYVRERMLGMAALLGSAQHMPALLEQLAPGKKESSVARSEVLALNAIAAITSLDLRHDHDGAPREVATVAAETLAACARK